jgi:hypothetical protein
MSDDIYYTYQAVNAIVSDCCDDESVDDVRTVYGNDWVVIGMEIADGEVVDSHSPSTGRTDPSEAGKHPWMSVPKYGHFPEDAYSGGRPNLKVSIGDHVYEKPLTDSPPNITAERARPHDDLHAMYGTAVPSDIDLEELRRLIDEKDCTLAEALERMETLQTCTGSQPSGYSHECSYCGSKAAIDADGQVVKDCETCDKRRYYEPIGDGEED